MSMKLLYESLRWRCSNMDLRESMRDSTKVFQGDLHVQLSAKLFCLMVYINCTSLISLNASLMKPTINLSWYRVCSISQTFPCHFYAMWYDVKLKVVISHNSIVSKHTVHGKILVGWRIWWIMSYLLKFSSPIFTDTPKMYLAYAPTVAYSPNFSLPIAFTCMVWQNFPRQIFLMYSITQLHGIEA